MANVSDAGLAATQQATLATEAAAQHGTGPDGMVPDGHEAISAGGTNFQMKEFSKNRERMTLYHRPDGEPRRVMRIDAGHLLARRLPDGTPEFWFPELGDQFKPPEYKLGNVICYLWPNGKDDVPNSDRKWVDSLGLEGKYCNAGNPLARGRDNFRTIFDRDTHMESKHNTEWGVIQRAQDTALREEDREYQRATLELLRRQVEGDNNGATTQAPTGDGPTVPDPNEPPRAKARSAKP